MNIDEFTKKYGNAELTSYSGDVKLRYKAFSPLFRNLYENKIIYHERFAAIVLLENIIITPERFEATAIPYLLIEQGNFLDEYYPNEKWSFSSVWDQMTFKNKHIESPYANWSLWTDQAKVKRVEKLVLQGKHNDALLQTLFCEEKEVLINKRKLIMEEEKNENTEWISVNHDLKFKKHNVPKPDSEALIWIKKTFRSMADTYAVLHDYEIYSNDLHPIFLKEGNFTCILIADHYVSLGCGNHCSIKFLIKDNNNVTRGSYGLGQKEEGIIEIIKILRVLANYEDWASYDKNPVLKGTI